MQEYLERHLRIRVERADPQRVLIVAELSPPGEADLKIAGQIHGPLSRFHRTLESTSPFREVADPRRQSAEALLLDPCFWLPGAPFLYEATVALIENGHTVATCSRQFGVGRLEMERQGFVLNAKRWTMRAIDVQCAASEDWQALRDAAVTLVVDDPGDGLCREVSQEGVPIVARLSADMVNAHRLEQLGRWPAVFLVWVPKEVAGNETNGSNGIPTVAHEYEVSPKPSRASREVRIWRESPIVLSEFDTPTLAWRPLPTICTLKQARAECDDLQRQMAGRSNLAGYIFATEAPRRDRQFTPSDDNLHQR